MDSFEILRGFLNHGVYLRNGPTDFQRINNALSVPEATWTLSILDTFRKKTNTYDPSSRVVAPSSTSTFLYSGIAWSLE